MTKPNFRFLIIAAAIALYFVILALSFWRDEVGEAVGSLAGQFGVVGVSTGVSRTPGRRRIVASLSTFPARMEMLSMALDSLFRQTLPLDAIYVNIPDRVRRFDVPINETQLAADMAALRHRFGPRLLFNRGQDYGPATKLLTTLLNETHPDTLIATFDDDIEYDPNIMHALYESYRKHPDHFIAPACEEIVNLTTREWVYIEDDRVCNGWACAYRGVLYRVGMFDVSIFNYAGVPTGCFIHDDVYFSGFLMRKGIRPYHIALDFSPAMQFLPTVKGLTVGNTEGVRDHQAECIEYFNRFEG